MFKTERSDLGHQGFDRFVFRHFPQDAASPENQKLAFTAGYADIRAPRLSRSVDRAAHHRHSYRCLQLFQAVFDRGRNADQIDHRATTGRAGNEFNAAPSKAKRL